MTFATGPDTLVCVDFDDTLVVNQAHFAEAVERLCTICRERLGVEAAVTREAFESADARYHPLGRHRNRFLMTVFAAFCQVAGVEAVPLDLVAPLAAAAAHPYDAPPTPEPGVDIALARLRAAHRGPLWLVTTGDLVVQHGRVQRSGLGGHFDQVHVLADKNAAAFAQLGRIHRHRWMIGNSPATDILPALAAGYEVAYVRTETWTLDMRPVPPGIPAFDSFAAAVDGLLGSP